MIPATFLDHVVLVGTDLRLALQEARVTSAVEHVDNNNKRNENANIVWGERYLT